MKAANIRLAKTAGFCFGVNKAVNMVRDLLDEGRQVCTLGPIIHNPQVVEELTERGVRIVEVPEEVPAGCVLVIRSHGVAQEIYDKARELGLDICDATCPFVAEIGEWLHGADRRGRGTSGGDGDSRTLQRPFVCFFKRSRFRRVDKNRRIRWRKTSDNGGANHL